MRFRRLDAFTGICVSLALTSPSIAEAADAQSIRSDSVGLYSEDRNSLCAAGEIANDGCDEIRARRIVDATALPWRAIGRVNVAGVEHRSHCTGTMVSESVALTAAHCLYNEARASWISAHGLRFAAGYQSGSSVAVSAVERYTVSPSIGGKGEEWKHTPSMDWALLFLEEPIGRETGIATLAPLSTEDKRSGGISLAGYTGLRPHVLSVTNGCSVVDQPTELSATFYRCAAMMGDSGGPIFVQDGDTIRIVAVLSGVGPSAAGLHSIGVPTSAIMEALRAETEG